MSSTTSSPGGRPDRRRRGLRPAVAGVAAGLILSAGFAVAAWPVPTLANAPDAKLGTVVGEFTPAQVVTLLPTPGAVAFQTITVKNTGTLASDYRLSASYSNSPFSLPTQGAALAVKASAVPLAANASCDANAFTSNPPKQLLMRFSMPVNGQLAVGASQNVCMRLERDKGEAYTGDLKTAEGKTSSAKITLTADFTQTDPGTFTPVAAPAGTMTKEATA